MHDEMQENCKSIIREKVNLKIWGWRLTTIQRAQEEVK